MNIFAEMGKSLSFSNYRLYRSDRGGKNFLYLLMLSIIGFIIVVMLGFYVPVMLNGGIESFLDEVPDFSMSSDGILTIDHEPIDSVTDENQRLVVDTGYEYGYDDSTGTIYRIIGYADDASGYTTEDVIDVSQYSQSAVISKNALVMYQQGQCEVLEYNEIPANILSKISNEGLLELIKSMAIIITVIVFFAFIIRLALWNIVNAAIGAIISSNMGVKNTFGQNYAMALRAYTPVYLVSCILVAFGISVPFKWVIMLLVTGFILSKAIKTIKAQLEKDAAEAAMTAAAPNADSDLMFRAMYGENDVYHNTGSDTNTDGNDNRY